MAFRKFPTPVKAEDTPLVTAHGTTYRCTGCGADVPPGVWITEQVESGNVVGMTMRIGADGDVVHSCGEAVASSQPST
jgi:hypothetical protein